jgi:hypothetical protein
MGVFVELKMGVSSKRHRKWRWYSDGGQGEWMAVGGYDGIRDNAELGVGRQNELPVPLPVQ